TSAMLRNSRLSRRLLLLRATCEEAKKGNPAVLKRLQEAYDVLSSVQRVAPKLVERLLLHPGFGIFLHRFWEQMERDSGDSDAMLVRVGRLAGVAAAAAIRARVNFTLVARTWEGTLMLPTLGLAVFGRDGLATVHHDDGVASLKLDETTVTIPAD